MSVISSCRHTRQQSITGAVPLQSRSSASKSLSLACGLPLVWVGHACRAGLAAQQYREGRWIPRSAISLHTFSSAAPNTLITSAKLKQRPNSKEPILKPRRAGLDRRQSYGPPCGTSPGHMNVCRSRANAKRQRAGFSAANPTFSLAKIAGSRL